VSGYAPRVGLILYDGHLLIKDYRKNKHIIKTLKKINKTFLNKLKKALSEPKEENFSKLFDRTDVIEEFYILYKKAREYLLKNISGVSEEEKREEFVDNFMMQMLTLWYLQERGFFNNEKDYFITRFKIISNTPLAEKKEQLSLFPNSYKQLSLKKFPSFYHFLIYLFEKISGHDDKQYIDDDPKIGRVVVIGPAVFLNGEHSKAISIPDNCFYKEGVTDILINTPPKKLSQEVSLLNLFESRDWTEGNIDEFVLGAIYEKLITYMERKKLGAYYTPEEITSYICKHTIEPYLIDGVNERFNKKFETIDQIIESNDREIILYLFEQLKEIKILDPAVGSAHFLESAINVLVSIYEKIWDKAKELNIKKGLEIIATDEKGEIKEINLLEISDEDKFKLLVKFFIILSKNIYGVDINPSALKVAKARLFLTLAKHFKTEKEKEIFIRFPNIHFNLREGNSLIGYVELGKEKPKGQLQLDLFAKEEQAEYITEKIKVVSELKPHLEKTARALKIDENIVKEVENLNKILYKKKINRDDFEKVLRTKEELIRILIASLNSQYAVPLNELLREITDLFNQKLDEKFAEEYNIRLEDLKKIKTFHWIFEFPEVFSDRGGFDVVVGNPPYVRADTDDEFILKERELISRTDFYETLYEKWDIYIAFIERGLKLMRTKGYFSLIVEDSYNSSKYAKKSHKYILENATIKELNFCSQVPIFQGVGVRNSIFIFKKKKNPGNVPRRSKRIGTFENIQLLPSACQEDFGEELFNPRKSPKLKIEVKNTVLLKEICYVSYGLRPNADERKYKGEFKKADLISIIRDLSHPHPYLEGKMIRTWQIKEFRFLEWGTERSPHKLVRPTFPELYKPPKILFGSITGSTYDNAGFFCNHSIIVITPWINLKGVFNRSISKKAKGELRQQFEKLSLRYELKYLLLILNSKIGSYFIKQNQRNKLSVYPDDLSKLEIKVCGKETQKKYSFLSDYLLFLKATEERREELKDMIKFLDRQIADSIVYELYFKEKFHEDGSYPEPKEYLLEAVSKHLKLINYNRWAELYWKRRLEGNLTQEQERELQKLEKDNVKAVEESYNTLLNDQEVKKWVEKIKSHKWVKVIEEENV